MIQQTSDVFDENVAIDSTGEFTTLVSLEHLKALTEADQLAFQFQVDVIVGAGPFSATVMVQTSADGRTWVQKNPDVELGFAESGTWVDGVFVPNPYPSMMAWGTEPSPPNPSMGYVLLQIVITGPPGEVYRTRLTATGRSRTKRVARQMPTGKQNRQGQALGPATMHEVYGHLLRSTHLHGSERVAHVLRNLSTPARAEVETFAKKLTSMDPVVKRSIAHVAGALTHLMTAPHSQDDPADAVASAFGRASDDYGQSPKT